MIGRLAIAAALALPPMTCAGAAIVVPPKAERGKAGAACRAGESGPAVRVLVSGLKDRDGTIRLELYPANDEDFLAPDKVLIAAGKPFKRVEQPVPAVDGTTMCIRAPASGRYALSVLHDRDGDGKFGFLRDGVGFSNNPRLGRRKPVASAVALTVGPGVAQVQIVMNYRRGLGFGPLSGAERTSAR
ncbi:DUF2141 domain-containing protein [Sphingomonas sanxanigenens]|uniref:DUF2141 domain-containing protein n=1 Tax=Sphingomonas sanxanigenens DSM 19645 = NX02 TaxID=1123269 RepID=W0AG42_9SPHN|nr:DUF2141 domain-containing protein [Sphingomonas sanxanigenens]AHE55253.1 hypothetical protein NX02_17905 [Sphingomonas sanxanigenens DSM 19645 = NX02]